MTKRWPVVVLTVTGFAVRVAFIAVVRPRVPALGDASTYHLGSLVVASGHGFVNPYLWIDRHVVVPTAQFPPLFTLVLGAVAKAGVRSVEGQRIVNGAIGAAIIPVTCLVGRRVAGDRAALVAGALVVVHPLLFGSDAALMSESLDTLLVTTAVLCALRVADAPSAPRWAALGAVLAAAALTRVEGVLLALVLGVGLVVGGRVRGVVVGAVVFVALLVPWTIRNAATFHTFVPLATDGGGAIGGANCPPVYHGPRTGLWLISCNFAVPTDGLPEAAASARYRTAGVTYASHHLARLPAVAGVRVLRAWGVWNSGQQVDYESLEGRVVRWQALGQHLDWVLVPLGIAGAVVLRRRRVVVWPLLAPAAVATAVALLTYGNERFREPAEPMICVLVGALLLGAGATHRRDAGVDR